MPTNKTDRRYLPSQDRLLWLQCVFNMEFGSDENFEGLPINRIPTWVAEQLVDYDLIVLNSHNGRNGLPLTPYYTLTAWGERIVDLYTDAN